MLALPAGVWVATQWGYTPVFLATAAAPLLAVLSVPGLPRRASAPQAASRHRVVAGLGKCLAHAPGGDLLRVDGAGFGPLQNATLVLMYARVPAGGEDTVSALWNAAYDLGMAAGALGAGLLVTVIAYPATFVLTAAVMLPALVLVHRDRRL